MRRLWLALILCGTAEGCRYGYELDEQEAAVVPNLGGASMSSGGASPVTGDGGETATGGAAPESGGNGGVGGAAPSSGGMESMGGAPPEYGVPTGSPKVHCTHLAQLGAPPVLDGVIDDGVYLEEMAPQGWRHETLPIPSGHRVLFGAAWRPNGIYFFAVVEDSDLVPAPAPVDVMDDSLIWQGDGVEFYVDHDAVFDAPLGEFAMVGTRQILVAAPPNEADENLDRGMSRRSNQGTGGYAYYDPNLWVSKPFSDGYIVEAFVDAATLGLGSWTLAEHDLVGINLAVNVSGEPPVEGNRLSQYFLQIRDPAEGDDFDYPFRNESTFCLPELTVE